MNARLSAQGNIPPQPGQHVPREGHDCSRHVPGRGPFGVGTFDNFAEHLAPEFYLVGYIYKFYAENMGAICITSRPVVIPTNASKDHHQPTSSPRKHCVILSLQARLWLGGLIPYLL